MKFKGCYSISPYIDIFFVNLCENQIEKENRFNG